METKTYTVVLRNEDKRTDKNLKLSLEEAINYVKTKNGTNDKDFIDHEGGYAFVIDNDTKDKEAVFRYYEDIKPYPYQSYLSRIKDIERYFGSSFPVLMSFLNIEKTDKEDCYRVSYDLYGNEIECLTYNARAVEIILKEDDNLCNMYAIDIAFLEIFEELLMENFKQINDIYSYEKEY